MVMRQSMGFPSHCFLSPSINDLVMESRKTVPVGWGGRRGCARGGTLVLSPHRTLAAPPPPQAASQRGRSSRGIDGSPHSREGRPRPPSCSWLSSSGARPSHGLPPPTSWQ